MTKKENNKKLKRLDLDPTPPAQQSWRILPPSSWGHERKKARGKPFPPDGGKSNQRARARAHTQGENYKTPGVFLSADIVKYIYVS
ncbi:hypothetical protein [Thiolapillus sp.]|uniref:hypothetical protein n=1 Tax=Thiolapillus sp. TaxID=2017437 RepID=UPI003AF55953